MRIRSDKKQSIRSKISKMVLIVSILAVFLSAIVAFWTMKETKRDVAYISQKLGNLVATDSEGALMAQAEQNLQSQVQGHAALTENKLNNIETQVNHLAGYMTQIYSEQFAYPEVMVEKPKMENAGKWALQYSLVQGVSYENVAEEIKRAGNFLYVTKPLCANNEKISSVYFTSANGFMISYDKNSDNMFDDKKADEPAEVFAKAYDPRKQAWYQDVFQTKTTVFTKTYLDTFNRLLISCAAPVYDKTEQIIGVVTMDILIEDINVEIIDAQIGKNGYAFLLDNKGEIVTASNLKLKQGKYVTKNLLNDEQWAPLAEKMLTGENGVLSLNLKGRKAFAAYAPIEQTNWSIAMMLPESEVLAPALKSHENIMLYTEDAKGEIEENIRIMLFIFACALVLIVFCVILSTGFFSRRLTAPIIQLMDDVHIVSQGKLDHVVSVHTGDELEDLGTAFNAMTTSLNEYMNNLAIVQADRERIKTELHVATRIQASMLPCIFPAFPDRVEFDIFADMHPAKEVGGDFYDFFLTDEDHLWLVIADVSGKGVPAALFMVITKTLLKNHAEFESSPAQALWLTNEQLCANNEADMFVTAFMGVLEISTGKFTFSNAGHNYPLLCRNGEAFEWLESEPTLVLAVLQGVEYTDNIIELNKGDAIFMYTDGVTEALNINKKLYSDRRLWETLNKEGISELSLVGLLDYMKKDIAEFSDGAEQADDITMMALQIQGEQK